MLDLKPFENDESGVLWLQRHTKDGVGRKALYLITILTNIIYDQKENRICRRLPQEGVSGMQGGGRRNVAASLLLRAGTGASPEESKRIGASGYTGLQQLIGQWAEADGCWEDYADEAQTKNNRKFLTSGSESNVYLKDGYCYKVTDCSHYGSLARVIDRISLFNEFFPESAVEVLGFGIKDDATDLNGFSVITRQQHFQGSRPSGDEIRKKLETIGLSAPKDDSTPDNPTKLILGQYSNNTDSIRLYDLHDLNSVKKRNKIFVYDCEAYLNTDEKTKGCWYIPEINGDEAAVKEIDSILDDLMPETLSKEDEDSLRKNAALYRKLKETGYTTEPVLTTVNGKKDTFILEQTKDGQILAQKTENIAFMLGARLTEQQKKSLSEGRIVTINGKPTRFNVSKGRLEELASAQKKQTLKHNIGISL